MNPDEFSRRRRQLMRMMGKGSIAILPAAQPRLRNRDVLYPYRQDSDFYYLTGFGEPEAVAVLVPGRAGGEYLLFCRDRDPLSRRRGTARGPVPRMPSATYGADEALPIGWSTRCCRRSSRAASVCIYTMGTHPEFDQRLIGWVSALRARGGSRHAYAG